ncbi:MAG: ribosome maturation factor RimM [Betaproteobacteria bacterium]
MGRVAAPWGIKGWVKVHPLTQVPDTLLEFKDWWLRRRDGVWRQHTLVEGRQHGATLLAFLSGMPDREAAALFSGAEIGVPRSVLPEPEPGEIYWTELIGLAVVNREGVALGTVEAVDEFGAHPVLRVTDANEVPVRKRLIPFVDALVDSVDRAEQRITVDWQPDY